MNSKTILKGLLAIALLGATLASHVHAMEKTATIGRVDKLNTGSGERDDITALTALMNQVLNCNKQGKLFSFTSTQPGHCETASAELDHENLVLDYQQNMEDLVLFTEFRVGTSAGDDITHNIDLAHIAGKRPENIRFSFAGYASNAGTHPTIATKTTECRNNPIVEGLVNLKQSSAYRVVGEHTAKVLSSTGTTSALRSQTYRYQWRWDANDNRLQILSDSGTSGKMTLVLCSVSYDTLRVVPEEIATGYVPHALRGSRSPGKLWGRADLRLRRGQRLLL